MISGHREGVHPAGGGHHHHHHHRHREQTGSSGGGGGSVGNGGGGGGGATTTVADANSIESGNFMGSSPGSPTPPGSPSIQVGWQRAD